MGQGIQTQILHSHHHGSGLPMVLAKWFQTHQGKTGRLVLFPFFLRQDQACGCPRSVPEGKVSPSNPPPSPVQGQRPLEGVVLTPS